MPGRVHALMQDTQHANDIIFEAIQGNMAAGTQLAEAILATRQQRRRLGKLLQPLQRHHKALRIGFGNLETKALRTGIDHAIKIGPRALGKVKNGHAGGVLQP